MNRYYVLERENNDAYPLFTSADVRGRQVILGRTVDIDPGPFALRVGAPVPKAPQFVDFHTMPTPVVSKKLHDVLAPMDLHLVQLVPALLSHNEEQLPYWVVNIGNRFPAIDMAKSKYTQLPSGGISILEKLVLDPSKLDAVPDDQKLMFMPKEYRAIRIVAEPVKLAMEAVKPKGLRFFALDDWDDAASFR